MPRYVFIFCQPSRLNGITHWYLLPNATTYLAALFFHTLVFQYASYVFLEKVLPWLIYLKRMSFAMLIKRLLFMILIMLLLRGHQQKCHGAWLCRRWSELDCRRIATRQSGRMPRTARLIDFSTKQLSKCFRLFLR